MGTRPCGEKRLGLLKDCRVVPGLNSLIDSEVQSQAWKGGPLGRLIVVGDMQNLGDGTGDGGPGLGTRPLFLKKQRLEARNLHTLGRGQLEPYDILYDP